jgi:hypothetical protein
MFNPLTAFSAILSQNKVSILPDFSVQLYVPLLGQEVDSVVL